MLRQPRGGMEFKFGKVVEVPAPPPTLPAQVLRVAIDSEPTVQLNQTVAAAQPLCESVDNQHTHPISPIPGKVTQIDKKAKGFDIHIDTDEPRVPTTMTVPVPKTRKLPIWVETIEQLGPIGETDGRVGLLHQLRAALITRPDTVICVGADEFPPYPVQASLLCSFAQEAVQGTQLLAEITAADDAQMLVPQHRKVRSNIRKHARKSRVRLQPTDTHYASADPSLVIWNHARGKRRVSRRGSPMQARVLIVSPWTAIRLGRWLMRGEVDLARPVFVGTPEHDTPLEFGYAFTGQPIASLSSRIAAAIWREPHRVLVGNPLTGHRAVRHLPIELIQSQTSPTESSEPEPVIPVSGELMTLLEPIKTVHPSPCISCSWCAEVCPTSLRPAKLFDRCSHDVRKNEAHLLEQLEWCVQCGLCSHVCPSQLPLTQTFARKFTQLEESIHGRKG